MGELTHDAAAGRNTAMLHLCRRRCLRLTGERFNASPLNNERRGTLLQLSRRRPVRPAALRLLFLQCMQWKPRHRDINSVNCCSDCIVQRISVACLITPLIQVDRSSTCYLALYTCELDTLHSYIQQRTQGGVSGHRKQCRDQRIIRQ